MLPLLARGLDYNCTIGRVLLTGVIVLPGVLAREADAQFALPAVDEAKLTAAGIRKVEGRHLILYTDLPAAAEVDELPRVFDVAVPLWCDYFSVPLSRLDE